MTAPIDPPGSDLDKILHNLVNEATGWKTKTGLISVHTLDEAKQAITHRIEEAKAEAYLLGWNRVPLKSPFNHKSNADGSVDLELSTPKEGES